MRTLYRQQVGEGRYRLRAVSRGTLSLYVFATGFAFDVTTISIGACSRLAHPPFVHIRQLLPLGAAAISNNAAATAVRQDRIFPPTRQIFCRPFRFVWILAGEEIRDTSSNSIHCRRFRLAFRLDIGKDGETTKDASNKAGSAFSPSGSQQTKYLKYRVCKTLSRCRAASAANVLSWRPCAKTEKARVGGGVEIPQLRPIRTPREGRLWGFGECRC